MPKKKKNDNQKNIYISLRVKKELADELDSKIKDMWDKNGITISRSELIRRILKKGLENFENSNIETENVTQCNTKILPGKIITENANIAENPNIPAEIIAKARESFVTDNKYEPESDEDLKEYIEFYMKLDNEKK